MQELQEIITKFKKLDGYKNKLDKYAKFGKYIFLKKELNTNTIIFLLILMTGFIFSDDYLSFIGTQTYKILNNPFTPEFFTVFFVVLFWINLYNLVTSSLKYMKYENKYDFKKTSKKDLQFFLECHTKNKIRTKELQLEFHKLLDDYDVFCSEHDMDEVRLSFIGNDRKVIDYLNKSLKTYKNKTY